MGTVGHLLVSLVAETVIEKFGITVRCVPNATYVGRAYMARLADTHTTIEMALGMRFLQEGLFEYAGYDWGPQQVQYLFLPEQVGVCFAVNADSDITSGEQLKGKKIGRLPGSPSLDQFLLAYLAFFGLTGDDVENVEFPSIGAAWNAQIEGKIDTCHWNAVAPKSYELEAARGIRYLEMSPDNKEGWARTQAIAPLVPKLVYSGAGIKPGQAPLNVSCGAYPCFAAWEHLDPDIAYWITKAIVELYPDYKVKHDILKNDWTMEKHWSLWGIDVAPLHRGAVRYYKEAGMWNDERQKMQDERLARQAELKKLWDKVKAEGIDKGLKAKEFPAFWLEQKAAAGL